MENPLSEKKQLDLLIKWIGPQSQANPDNPKIAIDRIWERMDERCGAPEIVGHSLKKKLVDYPTLTNKDPFKLYDMVDILLEIEATKADPKFGPLLSYLDTSSGTNPIVTKLPVNFRDRWIGHAVQNCDRHEVYFPPFNKFVNFLRTESRVCMNPYFAYDIVTNTVSSSASEAIWKSAQAKEQICARKTNVDQCRSASHYCPQVRTVSQSHYQTQLADCKAFLQEKNSTTKRDLEEKRIMLQISETWTFHVGLQGKSGESCGKIITLPPFIMTPLVSGK